MSGLYIYCIGREEHPAPDGVVGIEDAAVEPLRLAGFGLWVSRHATAPAVSLDRVRRHNQVVERAAERVTPLPLRFGQWFEHEAALRQSLTDRDPALRRALERVDGGVEFGVRITDPSLTEPAPDRSSGRAYLEALARRARGAERAARRGGQLARGVREWLGPLVREQRWTPLDVPGGLATVAHLVDRHDIGSYDARVRQLPARHPTLQFVFSGPWPPYGFVEDAVPDA